MPANLFRKHTRIHDSESLDYMHFTLQVDDTGRSVRTHAR